MFNVANFLTAGNLISGILAIIFALNGDLYLAPLFIFCGAFFDFFDGFAARMLNQSGELGKQLDSLADMITFGVAPGIVMLVLLVVLPVDIASFSDLVIGDEVDLWVEQIKIGKGSYLPFFAFLFPFFALFRLAKFNIDTRQSNSFIGLPTPAATLFFMTFPLTLMSGQIEPFGWVFQNWVLIPLLVVFGLLMVSELPLFSLKIKHFNWKGNEIRIVFLLISLLLIVLFSFWAIALIVFLYLILSLVENNFFKNQKNEI